ncbi:MAG: asparagine synthase (glutamine-hydrolyzing) [Lachnospiraceae bacterium]|nr:asparagine synthase (glutamine-hydrolyzing) [Lachnospiraceae bacterium]
MCGIVGFTQDSNKMYKVAILEKMMERIAHRGPDGSGIYYDSDIALGHRRLSIIDIDGGEQPMKNEDESLVCVFNGEIYNYRELRDYLILKGHNFRTQSDTEVLLHGYEEWGYELPKNLRGMFAFAIWDKRKKELYCARDYFGVKPFYYYKRENCFLFASEIKSFLEHPCFEKVLNRKQFELYLSYQYSPGEETFFENVYKLPPACYLIRRKDGMELVSYWHPEYDADQKTSLETFAGEINEAMNDSVKAHKISDVEVGSFLSSGVDSAYLSTVSDVDKTFTLGYEDKKYDESYMVADFAKMKHLKNYSRILSKEEFFDKVEDIQYYMDEPLADAAGVALYFLDKEAAKYVKVCLSGEGADELFGGYNIYKEPFMCKGYNSLSPFIRRGLGAVAELLPAMPGRNFIVRNAKSIKERYIGPTSLFTENEKKKLLKDYIGQRGENKLNKAQEDESSIDDVTYMQMTDLNQWLVGDILLKADKMSMANSLEVRVPFLDKEVFEVAQRLPSTYRANKKETKIAFRKCAESVVGGESAGRTKRGFPVPIREWIKEEQYYLRIKECFESTTAKSFFNSKMLIRMLDNHESGRCDCWRQIWCVYVFLLWYDAYFVSIRGREMRV